MTRLGVLPAEMLEGWVLNLAEVVAAHADVFDSVGLSPVADTARDLAAFYKGQLATPAPDNLEGL